MCPFRKRNYKTDRNGNSLRSVAAFLSLIKATLFYSAIFVPSFIVTVPMSGTFALPLTEGVSAAQFTRRDGRGQVVADGRKSLYFNFRRGHLRLDYLEAVFAAVVKDAKRYISAIKHVADF